MNLYLISQDVNNGYDTYDSAVVAAETEQEARETHPSMFVTHITDGKWMGTYSGGGELSVTEYLNDDGSDWLRFSDIDNVKVELLGETEKERGVILASLNEAKE